MQISTEIITTCYISNLKIRLLMIQTNYICSFLKGYYGNTTGLIESYNSWGVIPSGRHTIRWSQSGGHAIRWVIPSGGHNQAVIQSGGSYHQVVTIRRSYNQVGHTIRWPYCGAPTIRWVMPSGGHTIKWVIPSGGHTIILSGVFYQAYCGKPPIHAGIHMLKHRCATLNHHVNERQPVTPLYAYVLTQTHNVTDIWW